MTPGAIHRLSREQADRHILVRVRGVVTYYSRRSYVDRGIYLALLFIQQGQNGIYVRLPYRPLLRLNCGDVVQVDGITDAGDFAPVLISLRIRKIAHRQLPHAPFRTPGDLRDGSYDSDFIALRGVIRSVQNVETTSAYAHYFQSRLDMAPRQTVLTLVDQGSTIPVRIPGRIADAKRLVDAEVTLRGVAGSLFSAQRQWRGAQLFVQTPSQITIERTGALHPFRLPVSAIAGLMAYHFTGPLQHMVHVRGEVIFADGKGTVIIEDQTAGLILRGISSSKIAPGQFVDAIGYVSPGPSAVSLTNARIRPARSGRPATPMRLRLKRLNDRQYDASLVTLTGTVAGHGASGEGAWVDLAQGKRVIRAVLDSSQSRHWRQVHEGARISVTGAFQRHAEKGINAMSILMRTPSDLVVLRPSASFQRRRVIYSMLWALLALLALALPPLLSRLRQNQRTVSDLRDQQKLILNSAEDGLIGVDRQGVVSFANPAAAGLLARSPREIAGRPLREVFDPLDQNGQPYAEAQWPVQITLLTQTSQQAAYELLRRGDGSRFAAEYSCTPLRDHDNRCLGALLSFRDVSKRFELDRMKSEFMSVVSHELRTPIAAIRAALGLVASGKLARQAEQERRMLHLASTNSERLASLVNDILDLDRLHSGKLQMVPQLCSAAAVVQSALDNIAALAMSNHLVLRKQCEEFSLWADRDRLLQVLDNLLSNAVKFSAPGGTITVSAAVVDAEVEFRVADQGRGIPAEMLELIFERFRQVDSSDARAKGGSGLGLTIVRAIVEQHHGKIWAESQAGQGSTFILRLPRSAIPAPPLAPLDAALPQASAHA